jgi:F-type H+-transporting ATPase subunit b
MKRISVLATAALLALPALAMAASDHPGTPAATAADTHGATGPITPFAGTIAQSIAALIVFGVVFVVLRLYAWEPILKGLTDREDKIKHDLESAEAANRSAAATLADYQRQIAGAEAQVREKLAAAQRDADSIAARLKLDAQAEIEAMKDRAAREIEESKNAALVEVRQQAASISTAIAAKILKREIKESDQAELVRSSLDELQAADR